MPIRFVTYYLFAVSRDARRPSLPSWHNAEQSTTAKHIVSAPSLSVLSFSFKVSFLHSLLHITFVSCLRNGTVITNSLTVLTHLTLLAQRRTVKTAVLVWKCINDRIVWRWVESLWIWASKVIHGYSMHRLQYADINWKNDYTLSHSLVMIYFCFLTILNVVYFWMLLFFSTFIRM